jgi:hypothetical protein
MPSAIADATRGCFIQKFVCSGVKSGKILHTISALNVGDGRLTLQVKKERKIITELFFKTSCNNSFATYPGRDIQHVWFCFQSSIKTDERDDE